MRPDRIRFSPPDSSQRHLRHSETRVEQVQIESIHRCAQDTTCRIEFISVTRLLARTSRVLVAAPIGLQIWTLHAIAHTRTPSIYTRHQQTRTQLGHKHCNVSSHNQVVRSLILPQHSLDGFVELAVVERCNTASVMIFRQDHENSSTSKSRLEGSQRKFPFWCQNLFCALEPRENDGAGLEL